MADQKSNSILILAETQNLILFSNSSGGISKNFSKKSLLTERQKGFGLSIKPERAGSDNGASDPFGGYWTRLGDQSNSACFFPSCASGSSVEE